jgi:hypothetical protein
LVKPKHFSEAFPWSAPWIRSHHARPAVAAIRSPISSSQVRSSPSLVTQ